jgi:hypothetical protein
MSTKQTHIKDKYKKDKYYFVIENNYLVYVNKNYIDVFIIPRNAQANFTIDDDKTLFSEKVASFKKPLNILFGDEPPYNNKYTNSGYAILIQISKNKYAVIGNTILTFTTNYKITEFYAPINGHYVYPFCIDEKGNYYLTEEKIILENYKDFLDKISIDPYDYFYKYHTPTEKKLNNQIIHQN